jgi:hypothetical protein
MATGLQEATGKEHSVLEKDTGGLIPLNVIMSPQRGRTLISFANRASLSNDRQRPRLAMFAHEEGSRVHCGLYQPFQLPSGRQAFFYYAKGNVQVCGGDSTVYACLLTCEGKLRAVIS